MKKLLVFFVVFVFLITTWLNSDFGSVDKSYYLSEELLDMTIPLDVTIDIEFLRSLSPAYE